MCALGLTAGQLHTPQPEQHGQLGGWHHTAGLPWHRSTEAQEGTGQSKGARVAPAASKGSSACTGTSEGARSVAACPKMS